MTDARVQSPEPANWLQYRGYDAGWGYSPLERIDRRNVGKPQLAWSYTTGQTEGHQAPPIVNGGYMYVATRGGQVIALDAKSGNCWPSSPSRWR
ncbi:PQQ-binding-like beta-propeller repeat protein [Aquincola sp. J276]|uniref:PQQ-binding-like beta-propeller repeat protein n=1 Tax=Aquincola sp. J276 TaxID=2898432 RepID=UPI0021506FDC|nr:PQQ-binding-like beta-propeller repeat protein [Aquincola sp. J276]MCR5867649.1 PQQ-binding-like beta-propeller repeat protein [Aquincola sp. J276]